MNHLKYFKFKFAWIFGTNNHFLLSFSCLPTYISAIKTNLMKAFLIFYIIMWSTDTVAIPTPVITWSITSLQVLRARHHLLCKAPTCTLMGFPSGFCVKQAEATQRPQQLPSSFCVMYPWKTPVWLLREDIKGKNRTNFLWNIYLWTK